MNTQTQIAATPLRSGKVIQTFHNPAQVVHSISVETQIKRVAAYCRVSTLEEEQELSYETQSAYYRRRIDGNPSMVLVDVYGDQGVSGLSAEKRPEFQRMLRDCEAGRIDLILCKSVSRFARNLAECIAYIRDLQQKGISVVFETEGLQTGEPSSEMILSILATIAQSESSNIREHLLWSHEQNNANGTPFRQAAYGYRTKRLPDRKLMWIIHEEEAKRVRLAFQMAAAGQRYPDILRALRNMENIEGSAAEWNQQRLYYMLKNEVYAGHILTNKTYKPDLLSERSKRNNGQRPQYYVENHHEALVEQAVFDRVQELLSAGKLQGYHIGKRKVR